MNINALFRPLAELEKAMAGLYAHLAERFSGDAELAAAFSRLSADERGHGNLVEYQRRMVQQNQALAVDLDVDLAELEAVLAAVKALRVAAGPATAEEAIRKVAALEASAAETHLKNALKVARPEIASLLDALGGDDRAHAGRLAALAAQRGIALEP